MYLRSKLATTVGVGALVTAALVGDSGQASATEASHTMGGCRSGFCGTIFNNTTNDVKVCLKWAAKGDDQAYQPAESCNSADVAWVQAKSVYGTPQGKDIDAFYIPEGTTYYGATGTLFQPPPRPRTWTHTDSGWWKFGNTTVVHIDWTSYRG